MHERIAVNALCFKGAPLAEQEAMWRELAPGTISFVTPEVFKEGEDKARAIVGRGGYRVGTCSHAFHFGPLPDDEEGLQTPRESLLRAIRFAASVRAESIYMVTGGRGTRSWEEAAQHFAAAIAPCLPEAKAAGIPILIETAPFFYAGTHLAHTLVDTITLAELAGIGVCIDLFSVWAEAGLRQTIERALPLTHLVQVGDYVVGDNAFPARAVPGDGDIPLAAMLEWIVKGGYAKSFDLELLGPRIADEGLVPAIARSARNLGDMLEKLGV